MCSLKKKKRIFMGCMATQLCVLSIFGGCSGEKEDVDKIVIVEQESAEAEYKLAVASIDDILVTKSINCVYTQLNSAEVKFAVSGKTVSQVHVKEGESVKKGQLLAELNIGDHTEEKQRLEYQIKRNKILLQHLEDNENYEISNRWLNFIYGYSFGSEDDLKEGISQLQKNDEYQRQDLEDAIALDQKQLNQINKEISQGKVYASASGVIADMKERLEGSTSNRDTVIMRINDNSKCIFETKTKDGEELFTEGKEEELTVGVGNGATTYKVIPYEMDKWEDTMKFVISEGADEVVIEPGTNGTISIVLEKKEQVLTLPVGAVHSADGKMYVYVVGENNMREVKWVETGVADKDKIEIVSGLTEGEKVIIK